MKLKKYYASIFTFLLTVIVALSVAIPNLKSHSTSVGVVGIGQRSSLSARANSNWTDTDDWGAKSLELSNGDFDSHSGDLPASPSSWDGTALSGSGVNSDDLKLGVIELTNQSFADNRINYGLDKYFAPGEFPQTSSTNKNALLVNTNGLSTAYGYKSSTIEFAANSFYMLSVSVKTGNFGGNSGASIILTGLEDTISFGNINTTVTSNQAYGWQKYTIFVQTSFKGGSGSLFLGVGHGDIEGGKLGFAPANGYALFANVQANQLSPLHFDNLTSPLSNIADMNDVSHEDNKVLLDGRANTIFNYNPQTKYTITQDSKDPLISTKRQAFVAPFIENGAFDTLNWEASGANSHIILDARANDPSNPYNLGTQHRSPNFEFAPNVLLMTTFVDNQQGGRFEERAIDIKLKDDLIIKRHQYYRFSVFVNPMNVSGGIGAYIHIGGKNFIQSDKYEVDLFDRNISGSGNAESNSYGWVERAFYIQGSAIDDTTIDITLGLGHDKEGLAGGNVMWANPSMQSIDSEEFGANSEGGIVLSFDPSKESKIQNSSFDIAGNFDRYSYPLTPLDWTFVDPASADTTDWSANQAVPTSQAIYGIVPTDTAHYNANAKNYRNTPRPTNWASSVPPKNLMLMQSPTDMQATAFGFRSSTFGVEANTSSAIQVSLLADTQGYGANLVLKHDKKVLGSIEQIVDTKNPSGALVFRTFTFFVEAGNSTLEDLSLEIWLGLGDQNINRDKLAAGYVFVDQVSIVELSDGLKAHSDLADIQDFSSLLTRYASVLHTAQIDKKFPDYFVYTNSTQTLFSFYRYDASVVKSLYDWNIASLGGSAVVNDTNTSWGVFDITTARGTASTGGLGLIPTNWVENELGEYLQDWSLPYYKHSTDNPFVLMLQNNSPTASRLSSGIKFVTEAESFYRVSVSLKANLEQLPAFDENLKYQPKGLGIRLSGTNFAFEDIRDTRDKSYQDNPEYRGWWNDEYKDFVFYVSTGSQSPELSIDITLGGVDNWREFAAGTVYINNFVFESVDANEFEDAIQDLDYEENFEHRLENVIYADLDRGEPGPPAQPDDPNQLAPINWFLLPAILFSIVAFLGLMIVIMRAFDKRAEHKAAPAPKKIAYDRSTASRKAITSTPIVENSYDLFDEDTPIIKTPKVVIDHTTEYEEIEVTEEIEVDVEEDNSTTAQQPTQSADNVDNDEVVIRQIGDDNAVEVKKKTITQTVVKKVIQPKVSQKHTNDWQDSFDD